MFFVKYEKLTKDNSRIRYINTKAMPVDLMFLSTMIIPLSTSIEILHSFVN